MDPMRAQQLAAELEVEMMADMYNRYCLVAQGARWRADSRGYCQQRMHERLLLTSDCSSAIVLHGFIGTIVDYSHRMTNACHRKCVPPHYKEAELSKGESVCLDRCVSKYLDIHERMGKKLTELSLQDEELMKKMQQGVTPAQ